MIRAYVVDDEPLAVRLLTQLLEATGSVEVVGSTTDPVAALAQVRGRPVDVLFVDVQMPELTGFDLVRQLDAPPLIVFTTAYDRYALEAFDANSIDYLLKPIEPDRLARAVAKVARMKGGAYPDVRALAQELASRLAPQRPANRIASRTGERVVLLDVARVTHFVARDRLTFAVVNGHEHVVDRTLAELETILDARRFIRIHRSAIVNLSAVQEIDRWVDGGMLVRLGDDKKTELSIARDRVRELRQRLGF